MKRALKICLLAIFVVAAGFTGAQAQKFAHIDSQALIAVMPETATAQTAVEKEAGNMEELMGTMQTEYQTKLAEFTQKGDSLSEIVRQAKIEDLQNLEQRIRNFQQTASQKLQQKQGELMQPILKKANDAIEAVAKEQGVTYVFDANALLYKATESTDLLPLVKAKLGIQ
ncbi:OmpH family outer membrane protein [Sunxiuqinia sp. A32]|uniref:OmpH family outer membrane protein n=1 Tax=Sunxiuqinia sp. A32 TaxID=3461496 RepID=UPI0040452FEC